MIQNGSYIVHYGTPRHSDLLTMSMKDVNKMLDREAKYKKRQSKTIGAKIA